jgi:hypothetical protein
MTNSLQPPPLQQPFLDKNGNMSIVWQQWLTAIQLNLQSGVSSTTGVGNGANANVQAPALGTGGGPANPNLVKEWLQFTVGGSAFWVPIFQ